MKQKWIWLVLLIVTFTLGLAFSAFAIAATPMSIKHNQKLSTPYELIKKTILHKHIEDDGDPLYSIAWAKTNNHDTTGVKIVASNCILLKKTRQKISLF